MELWMTYNFFSTLNLFIYLFEFLCLIFFSPNSRRFRSKSEIINYLRDNSITKYHIGMFDFSLHRYRSGIKRREVVEQAVIPAQVEVKTEIVPKKEGLGITSCNISTLHNFYLQKRTKIC